MENERQMKEQRNDVWCQEQKSNSPQQEKGKCLEIYLGVYNHSSKNASDLRPSETKVYSPEGGKGERNLKKKKKERWSPILFQRSGVELEK